MVTVTAKVITVTDKGLKEVLRKIDAAGKFITRVGVLNPQASEPHPLRQNITVGEVAIINEYGSSRAGVPKRSFLKSTFTEQRDRLYIALLRAARIVIAGNAQPQAALHAVGTEMVKAVIDTIAKNVPPPNQPHTVDEKGHDHALIHTETLMHSISADVISSGASGSTVYSGEPDIDLEPGGANLALFTQT